MPLDFLIFDPSQCRFPAPRVPPLPDGTAGLSLLARRTAAVVPDSAWRHFVRARYALREAYRLAGIGPRGALLAPAYHCRTMIDPALALAGEVLLYGLNPDLSADLASIETLRQRSTVPIRALLATHFFGIPQRLDPLAAWCDHHGITLVEDCSHALYLQHTMASGIGHHGDFVVSSPYKFIPCPDGGLLHARQAEALETVRPRPQPPLAELRGLFRTVELARHRRPPDRPCAIDTLDDELARLPTAPTGQDGRRPDGISADYRPAEEGLASLGVSRLLMRHADIDTIGRRRRTNYGRWAAALATLPACRPLYPELPDTCIPYMFPLLLENPDQHFAPLKQLGVPIWRWDCIAASSCPTANGYRRHLLHLPCHQSLGESELAWMIAAVSRVLGRTPAKGS